VRAVVAAAVLCAGISFAGSASADPPGRSLPPTVGRVCTLIERNAAAYGLPADFLARLIWKESRFDPNAVSPAGAEGIAQFMPGTAAMRGLANAFDVERAIPASARYLAELKSVYGNLGLAAAAYNAGENRVSRWLASGGFLPIETEGYVLDIMGEPVDKFADTAYAGTIQPLDPKAGFADSCRRLPQLESATIAMATVNLKPWGIQVAGNFRRSAAVVLWQRIKARYSSVLGDYDAVVSRVRTPMGRAGIYAVRVGVDDRAGANGICRRLHAAGGACVVVRNR
jgi:soluble lytic murein transglycosylase-like protein